MKKLRFIFIFIFLAGMLFTVFQYIPTLEEETQGHATELAKKSCEDDHSDDDSNETNFDGDDAITAFFNFNFSDASVKTSFRSTKKDAYNSFIQKINVPPPKA